MDTKTARQFLDLLGHRGDLASVTRVPHPDKRNHIVYEASHPGVGAARADDERTAWSKLCDLAERQGPLPDVCQAKTKSGGPCKNAPQRGQRYCGSHLSEQPRTEPEAQPGLCQGTTKKGRPCQNAPQRGEAFCGPHLTKMRASDSNAQ